jgi:CRP/FNR family transcriptional regulator
MGDLRQVAEFSTSPDLIDKINQFGIRKTFPVGSIVVSEHSYSTSIPIILKGTMKVVRTDDDDKEILLYYVGAGESCIVSLLDGLFHEAHKIRAEVVEEADILFLPMEKVSLFLREYPQWLDYIFRLYHKRFEELLDMVKATAFHTVDERLLALLRTKKKMTGSNTIQITHEQLARELGTARVVVSRLLKQLEEAGKVALGRNKVVVMEA